MPSYSEGSSIALFEAMSMECFCIAAKVGDVSRIISNKSNGLVFDHTEKNFNNSINYYTKLSSKKISVIKKRARTSLQKSIFGKKYYRNFYKNNIFGK